MGCHERGKIGVVQAIDAQQKDMFNLTGCDTAGQ